jgi:hypothetical protein
MNAKIADAGTIGYGSPTNLPDHAIRYNRSVDIFEEWNLTAWTPKLISLAGGGTGAANAAGARANLGLGSMATQNSNAVAITGGSITGVNFSASDITAGVIALARGGTGASLALGGVGTVLLSNGSGVVFDSGINISQVNANAIQGVVPAAKLPANIGYTNANNTWSGTNNFTGPLYGAGTNLTAINAYNINQGIVHPSFLGTGFTGSTALFLRGDGAWAPPPGSAGASVPPGLIAMFDTSCPAGWTRFAALDNRFPLGYPAYGSAGGADQHYHDYSGSTDGAGGHSHNYGNAHQTDNSGNHSHSFSGSGRTDSEPNDYIRADAENDVSASGQYHSHSFSYSGETSGAGDHSHTVQVYGSVDSAPNHSHGFSGSTGWSSHIPPYLTMVFCRKD